MQILQSIQFKILLKMLVLLLGSLTLQIQVSLYLGLIVFLVIVMLDLQNLVVVVEPNLKSLVVEEDLVDLLQQSLVVLYEQQQIQEEESLVV